MRICEGSFSILLYINFCIFFSCSYSHPLLMCAICVLCKIKWKSSSVKSLIGKSTERGEKSEWVSEWVNCCYTGEEKKKTAKLQRTSSFLVTIHKRVTTKINKLNVLASDKRIWEFFFFSWKIRRKHFSIQQHTLRQKNILAVKLFCDLWRFKSSEEVKKGQKIK